MTAPTTRETADHAELARLAEAATPGPWRWEISLKAKQVALCGGPPRSGFGAFDHDVMSFRRWGMSGAAPVFWRWEGNLGHPKRADEVAVPVEGREHHAAWFRTIDDPNAAFIAAANPATVLALLSEIAALRGENDRLAYECDGATLVNLEIRALQAERQRDELRKALGDVLHIFPSQKPRASDESEPQAIRTARALIANQGSGQ